MDLIGVEVGTDLRSPWCRSLSAIAAGRAGIRQGLRTNSKKYEGRRTDGPDLLSQRMGNMARV